MAANIDLKPYVAALQGEFDMLVSTMREKGAKRFGKALAISSVLVFASYAGLYAPPRKKSARLQSEIDAARKLSEFGTQYKDLRDQLAASYAQLPTLADKEMFLSNAVIDSLKAEGLTPENFQPVREQEQTGLVFQSCSIAMPCLQPSPAPWRSTSTARPPITPWHGSAWDDWKSPGMPWWSCS